MRGVDAKTAYPLSSYRAEHIDAPALTQMLLGAFASLQEQSSVLSELDRAIGDGDHGTTMSRAAGRIRDRLRSVEGPRTVGDVLRDVGMVFLDLDGGATGPIFGSFFTGMGTAASSDAIDAAGLRRLFEEGLASVQTLSRAVPGDKTMLDALVPAVEAVRTTAANGEDLAMQLEAAASAAEAGAVGTRHVRARHGRAKHLGDRVLGHEDPGARSVAILLRGFADAYVGARTTED